MDDEPAFGFFGGPQLRIGIRVGRLLRLVGHRLTVVDDFAPFRTPSPMWGSTRPQPGRAAVSDTARAGALRDLIGEHLHLGDVQSTVARVDGDGHEYRTVIRGGVLSARARTWLAGLSFTESVTTMPLCFGPRGLHLPPHNERCFVLNAEHTWERVEYPPEQPSAAPGQRIVQRSDFWMSSRPDMTLGGYTASTYRVGHGLDGVSEHVLALLPTGEVYFAGLGEGRAGPRVAGGFNNLLAPFVCSVMVRSFVFYAELQAERAERGDVPLNLVTDHRSASAALDRYVMRRDRRLWLARRFAAGLDRLIWLAKLNRTVSDADPGPVEMLFPFLLSLVLILDDDQCSDFSSALVLLDEQDRPVEQTPVPVGDLR
ncbi:hypothetical protein [Dactylosporangium sp. NPDC005555]|uniref:hypothetical protein n=1 Tax=Dactylosporangium sp. NPDC005555 TaxID=3154889 RepID=UPI0033B741B3